jgi:hypothetical protein
MTGLLWGALLDTIGFFEKAFSDAAHEVVALVAQSIMHKEDFKPNPKDKREFMSCRTPPVGGLDTRVIEQALLSDSLVPISLVHSCHLELKKRCTC